MSRWTLLLALVVVSSSCALDGSGDVAVPDSPTSAVARSDTAVTTSTGLVTTSIPTTRTEATTSSDSDALEVAKAVYEEWIAAWEAHDADRIAAVFTPDGVYINPLGEVVIGRDAMKAYVPGHVVRDGQLGVIARIEPGVFRAPFVFEAEGPTGWLTGSGDLELELDGELAMRIEFVTFDGFN